MKKRLLSILSIIACLCLVCTVSVTSVRAEDMESQYPMDMFSAYTNEWINTWTAGDFSKVDANNQQYSSYGMKVNYDVTEDAYNDMIKELGTFKELGEASISYDDTRVIINQKATFENRDVDFVFSFDTKSGEIIWTTDMSATIGELVGKAGLNTLMGMGTVFCVLIFISFIISLFKILNKAGSKKKVEEPTQAPAPAPAVAPVADTTDDNADEIAAVIAAAIAAYEEDEEAYDVPADGLFVRSIRKRGFC